MVSQIYGDGEPALLTPFLSKQKFSKFLGVEVAFRARWTPCIGYQNGERPEETISGPGHTGFNLCTGTTVLQRSHLGNLRSSPGEGGEGEPSKN